MPPPAFFGVALDVFACRLTVLAVNGDRAACRADALVRDRENPVFVFDLMGEVRQFYDWLRSYGVTSDDAKQIVRDLGKGIDDMTRRKRRDTHGGVT